MRHCNGHRPAPNDQQGIALLAGVILLTAISLLALVATNSMILQRHMAGNFSEGQRARQAAAFATLHAKRLVFGIAHGTRFTACLQDCFPDPWAHIIRQPSYFPIFPEYETTSWWQSEALEAGPDTAGADEYSWDFAGETPRFLIEEVFFDDQASALSQANAPTLDGIGYYRILGRAVGRGTAQVAVSEAIVARPWLSSNASVTADPNGTDYCALFSPWYDCGLLAWRQRR